MKSRKTNRRMKTCIMVVFIFTLLAVIAIGGMMIGKEQYEPNFSEKNLTPSLKHLFGTDWMGRDMFVRTIKGLSLSIGIGVMASLSTSVIALLFGTFAGLLGKRVQAAFNWLVDLFMGIPHLILLILISMILGKGAKGVTIGVMATHWCTLGRIVQAEILSLKESHYVKAAEKLGRKKFYIAMKHIIPHVLPQFIVGLVLMFPHAIMHEASVTFLGFGLPLEQPAIGIILSESMKYISTGMWWLAVLPGVCLLFVVVLFDRLGNHLSLLLDPIKAQE